VDGLVADLLAPHARGVGAPGRPAGPLTGDPLARPALDASELLDVDVDEAPAPQ
jgi:hypothetical protein